MSAESPLLQPAGRVLSTLEQDGSRRWLYPRLSKGKFWNARRAVAYLLIAIYASLPFVPVNGKPAVLLDVVHRRFTILGFTFLPTDTILLALFAVTVILLVFLTTALLGRVWCGWACPQTVYLEFLYRPIERLFLGRTGVGGKPKPDQAGWRHAAMYAVYFVFSLHLANTFLAYFVGAGTLHTWVLGSPLAHPAGFAIVAVVTGAMMFNFTFFREQTCLIACPYGRLQSVLLDRQSLIISYDTARGEPRGKMAGKAKVALPVVAERIESAAKGDCVDCGLCQAVCPTGIDIRDGLQFECVGCAQCIDVCNDVMAKVNRPAGLIRYGSQAGMAGEKPRLLRPRVVIYPLLILAVGSLLGYLLVTKSPTDVTVLRGPGQPFLVTQQGEVVNVIRVKVTNRTDEPQRLAVTVAGPTGLRAVTAQPAVALPAGQTTTEAVEVFAPAALFAGSGSVGVTVRVTSADPAVAIDRPFKLLGPSAVPATTPTTTATQPGAH
ncbi:MAG TPA: cytochrome c oxidase accessory protein CcoG [Humisphaera sp.]